MTNYRGFVIGYAAIPVSSVNATITRNAIVESTMGSVGAPAIYGGVYSASGTLEAPYRTDVEPLIISLFGGPIADGVIDTSASSILTNVTLADQYGVGVTFASATVTSMDLTMQVKDYCKTSFNYIGVKGVAGAVTAQPSYTNPVAIFYNALLTVASTTVSAMGVTIHVERPIDTDYFVLGTEFLQGFNQSGPAVISGSLTLAPPEATLITTAINLASTDTITPSNSNANPIALGSLVLVLRNPAGTTDIRTITINSIVLSDLNISGTGMEKFGKTINYQGIINESNNIKFT
jgi:hypothetical protein